MATSSTTEQAIEALNTFLEHDKINTPLGKRCDEKAMTALATYLQVLLAWGKQMDLVSPGSDEQLFHRHFLDCYAATRIVEPKLKNLNAGIVDVGSGAGFPGMVMAILLPAHPLFLVEPREKRCLFLAEVKRKLRLENVQVIRSRFEDAIPKLPQPIGLVISRALGSYPQFINGGAELLKQGEGGYVSALVGTSFVAPKDCEELPYTHIPYRLSSEEPVEARGLALWKVEGQRER